jgi:MoxR-like ATPase
VQFTPDLLPGDLTGTPVFVPDRGEFELRRGPVFTRVLLADEINRAPAKVQSALLEAMEERQVTVGDRTLELPDPFFVMATQNPVELEGTYPLPEAQIDRFLLKLRVPYPSADEERAVVARDAEPEPEIEAVTDEAGVHALRAATKAVYVADEVEAYAVELVRATRDTTALVERLGGAASARPRRRASPHDDSRNERLALLRSAPVALGASPRASIALVRAARARALLDGRAFATPADVKNMAPAVLRHRIALSYEAEADGVTPDAVLEALLASVETP